MLTEEVQKEIDLAAKSKDGKQMISEFNREELFCKAYDVGKKIVSSDLNISDALKIKKLDLLKKEMILEVGAGNRRLAEKVVNMDIVLFENTDVVGDAHNLPFVDDSFDVVWIEMVLEHVRDPQRVVGEIRRVLKPGGYVYSMTPFIMPFHGYPGDYQRYTLSGLDELFKLFSKESSGVYKGPSVALVNYVSDYFTLFSFSGNRLIFALIKAFFLCLLFPVKYLDRILVKNSASHKLSNALFYLGRK